MDKRVDETRRTLYCFTGVLNHDQILRAFKRAKKQAIEICRERIYDKHELEDVINDISRADFLVNVVVNRKKEVPFDPSRMLRRKENQFFHYGHSYVHVSNSEKMFNMLIGKLPNGEIPYRIEEDEEEFKTVEKKKKAKRERITLKLDSQLTTRQVYEQKLLIEGLFDKVEDESLVKHIERTKGHYFANNIPLTKPPEEEIERTAKMVRWIVVDVVRESMPDTQKYIPNIIVSKDIPSHYNTDIIRDLFSRFSTSDEVILDSRGIRERRYPKIEILPTSFGNVAEVCFSEKRPTDAAYALLFRRSFEIVIPENVKERNHITNIILEKLKNYRPKINLTDKEKSQLKILIYGFKTIIDKKIIPLYERLLKLDKKGESVKNIEKELFRLFNSFDSPNELKGLVLSRSPVEDLKERLRDFTPDVTVETMLNKITAPGIRSLILEDIFCRNSSHAAIEMNVLKEDDGIRRYYKQDEVSEEMILKDIETLFKLFPENESLEIVYRNRTPPYIKRLLDEEEFSEEERDFFRKQFAKIVFNELYFNLKDDLAYETDEIPDWEEIKGLIIKLLELKTTQTVHFNYKEKKAARYARRSNFTMIKQEAKEKRRYFQKPIRKDDLYDEFKALRKRSIITPSAVGNEWSSIAKKGLETEEEEEVEEVKEGVIPPSYHFPEGIKPIPLTMYMFFHEKQ